MDLSVGPQYVLDNYEEDDGQQSIDDEVDNDDNDTGQSRPKQKKDKPMKRKMSPRKQKMTTRTKKQRTSGDTSPVGDDSTVSSQTVRELLREMSDMFEDIVKKEILAMERRTKRCFTRVENSVAQLLDARRQEVKSLPLARREKPTPTFEEVICLLSSNELEEVSFSSDEIKFSSIMINIDLDLTSFCIRGVAASCASSIFYLIFDF
ncbi:hypothetical protein LWI29_033663 [Acer saccharum]|uniref:Uncharacterized protein n=1 Tax=Acer saccharum TaxID=4024 RepID=A0AA39T8M9_ACESA|nr:hypothetical protein LWI29_033663 [Acer saccharum]